MAAEKFRVKPGHYDLNAIQKGISASVALPNQLNTLKPFTAPPSTPLDMLGFTPDAQLNEKRMEAIRSSQTSEPFRPFLELLLNSVDYSLSENPHITIRVAQLQNGGWQIVVQDRPEGTGMDADTLLNTYLDPYASGSSQDRRTPGGKWKKGFMGVGAQQQISLLKRAGDEIYVSALAEDDLTLVRLRPKENTVEMTIGGKKVPDVASTEDEPNPIKYKGVSQIIRLTPETCQDISFTPENFAVYLHDRLGVLQNSTIDMTVMQTDPHPAQKIEGISPAFEKSFIHSKKTLVSETHQHTQGNKTETIYHIAQEIPTKVRCTVTDAADIVYSETQSDEALVYLNVLGVRVGDPFVVRGKKLPSTVDLRFHEPIETITEGRRSTGLTEKNLEDLIKVLTHLEFGELSENPKSNTQISLSLLSALAPIYESYEKMNRWHLRKGMSLVRNLKNAFQTQISKGIAHDITILPDSLLSQIKLGRQSVTYVPSQYIDQEMVIRGLEAAHVPQVQKLKPPVFLIELKQDEPLWVSPEGVLFVNQKYFEKVTDRDLIKIMALISNRQDAGEFDGSWRVEDDRGAILSLDLPNIPSLEDIDANRKWATELFSKRHYERLSREWNSLDYEQKKQGINEWLSIMYVDSSITYRYSAHDIEQDKDGYFFIKPRTGDLPNKKITRYWFELSDNELDLLWKAITININTGQFGFAPSTRRGPMKPDMFESINSFAHPITEAFLFQVERMGIEHFKPLDAYNPAILELYRKHNLSVFKKDEDVLLFISSHAGELATLLGLKSEEKKQFMSVWAHSDKVRSMITLSQSHIGLTNLILFFPDQITYIVEMFEQYDGKFLNQFVSTYVDPREYPIIAPKDLVIKILPFISATGIQLDYYDFTISDLVSPSMKDSWSGDQKFLWQLVNTNLEIQQVERGQHNKRGMQIDPARFPLIKFAGREKEVIESPDLLMTLNELQFPKSKIVARKRELLHPSLHLDQAPGSSYFEILKNAWQATNRESLPTTHRKIDISDFFSAEGNAAQYGFSVRDYVGMEPREALFKLIVPGVGEGIHGLHFLTVLKDADVVEVTTSKGGARGVLTFESIKNESGELTDFNFYYREDENTDGFVGTNVTVWHNIETTQLQTEAALLRSRMQTFGQQISPEHVAINLNGTTTNAVTISFAQASVSGLGTVSIKSGDYSKTSVSVDEIPLTGYDLQEVIKHSNVPHASQELILQSGLKFDIRDCRVGITRDNTCFTDPVVVNRTIGNYFEQNYATVLGSMLRTGTLNFGAILPEEIWYDRVYSVRWTHEESFQPDDWNDRIQIQKWILTQPAYRLFDGKNHSLADIIYLSHTNGLTHHDLELLPEPIRKRVKPGEPQETISAPFEGGIPIPDDIYGFLHGMTQNARHAAGIDDESDPSLSLFRGRIRGFEARACFSPPSQYEWNENMLAEIRLAQNGDIPALARTVKTAVHEATHEEKKGGHTDIFSHDKEFYRSVEQGIMRYAF
jgi:hypothetical protein